LIVILSYKFGSDMMIFLVIAILLSGITAFARLRLNEHLPLQVYSGFLLGLITILVVFAV
jgi:membrane-associated phospholipid phosphatase